MPGPATGATLAAVRRAWGQDKTVRVVSYRPGAADLAAAVAGPLAGRRLEQVRRHYGGPPEVVLVLQAGAPFCDLRLPQQLATAAGLAVALRRFRRASVVVGEGPGILPACLWLLVMAAGECVVGDDEAAMGLHERYKVPLWRISVEEAEPFPALPEGVEPATAGLYAPGGGRGLTLVEVPTTTLAARLKARGQLSRARALARLRGLAGRG
jgi:hypothetical protein